MHFKLPNLTVLGKNLECNPVLNRSRHLSLFLFLNLYKAWIKKQNKTLLNTKVIFDIT